MPPETIRSTAKSSVPTRELVVSIHLQSATGVRGARLEGSLGRNIDKIHGSCLPISLFFSQETIRCKKAQICKIERKLVPGTQERWRWVVDRQWLWLLPNISALDRRS